MQKLVENKKSAVDLTDLAIGIVVLGIVVSVGATILINVRDTNPTGSVSYNVSEKAAQGLAEYGKPNCPLEEESFNAKPEYRLISLQGQDRSVKHKNYALTTDKGFQNGRIYSLNTYNI
jgi:Zn-dependent M28 family amino/carboxypeptidase